MFMGALCYEEVMTPRLKIIMTKYLVRNVPYTSIQICLPLEAFSSWISMALISYTENRSLSAENGLDWSQTVKLRLVSCKLFRICSNDKTRKLRLVTYTREIFLKLRLSFLSSKLSSYKGYF